MASSLFITPSLGGGIQVGSYGVGIGGAPMDGTRLFVVDTAAVGSVGGRSLLFADSIVAAPAVDATQISVQGYVKNTSAVVGTTGHHIGTLGLAEDTSVGQIDLYGGEFKVEGRGTAGSQKYNAVVTFANFQGSAFAGTNRAQRVLSKITTDGTTALAQGDNCAIDIEPLVGGATKTGLRTVDPIASYTANGAFCVWASISEEITLSTSGTTTDSVASLLPANSIIDSVETFVTVAITGSFSVWNLGDATTAGRFVATTGVLTGGQVGLVHMAGNISTTAAGPTQASAAKVRFNSDAAATAGKIRVTVHYRQFIAPTS